MPAHPLASSSRGVMRASHITGFDPGCLSNLPRNPVDGPYAPVPSAVIATARRRRRTERETNAPMTSKNRIRVTLWVCQFSREVHSVVGERGS